MTMHSDTMETRRADVARATHQRPFFVQQARREDGAGEEDEWKLESDVAPSLVSHVPWAQEPDAANQCRLCRL
jgi:hypothetical protein